MQTISQPIAPVFAVEDDPLLAARLAALGPLAGLALAF